MNPERIEQITALLSEISDAPVECDGFTRLAVTILARNNIEYTAFSGCILHNSQQVIPYHFWIEIDGYIIDYRARMWLGDEAPHGIFQRNQYPEYEFIGSPAIIDVLDDYVFNILNDRSHIELLRRLGKGN